MDEPKWMDRLPDEVLVMVLSHLPARDLLLAARAVCRRWRVLVPERGVWRRCPLSVAFYWDEPLAMATLRVAPCLRHLTLDMGSAFCNFADLLVASASVAIASLELRRTTWTFVKRAIAAHAEHLNSLNVSLTRGIYNSVDVLETLSELKLVRLTLSIGSECYNDYSPSAWTVTHYASADLARRLALGTTDTDDGYVKMSLKFLDITSSHVPDALAASLVRASARSLEVVRIGSKASCPLAVEALAECAGQLRHADVEVQEGLPASLRACEKLTSLCLRGVRDDDDNTLEYLTSATDLTSLTLRYADSSATFKCLISLAASGRSSLVHLRLLNHRTSCFLKDEPLGGAGLPELRVVRLQDTEPEEFLLRWQSPPALQILDLGGRQCNSGGFTQCLFRCIRVAVSAAQLGTRLHVIRFKFFVCESEAAHQPARCCHRHRDPVVGRCMKTPMCGLFSHSPSEECRICSNRDHNVKAWLWSQDDNFDLKGMIDKLDDGVLRPA